MTSSVMSGSVLSHCLEGAGFFGLMLAGFQSRITARMNMCLCVCVCNNNNNIIIYRISNAHFCLTPSSQCAKTFTHSFIQPSYLTGRTQCVAVGDAKSKIVKLDYGVPKGSVLGPVLFTIYTATFSAVVNKTGFSYHLYADDTQLYHSA